MGGVASHRGIRALRGVSAAALATFTALIGHVAGGGDVPGWLGILAPLVLSVAAAVLLVGSRLSLVRLTIVVAFSQAMFHLLFVLGAPSGAASGGHHHAPVAPSLPVVVGDSHLEPAMWAGHALAVVVTVAALYRGEVLLGVILRLGRMLASVIARIFLPPLAPAAPARTVSAVAPVTFAVLARLVAAAPRRGPPALLA